MSDWIQSLPERTLDGTLAALAERQPEALALWDPRREFSYAQLEQAVGAVAGTLVARGLQPGQVVLAFPRRTWELVVLFLATARAGGIFAPLDAGVDFSRVEHVARWGAGMAFVQGRHPGLEERLARLLGDPARVLHGGAGDEGHLADLLGGPVLAPSTDAERVCYLNFTSGSTGMPKGAATTHANVQWNTRACVSTFPWQADERFLCLFAPHAHPHEHWARPLATGAACFMLDTLRPRTVLRTLQEQDISWLFAIPSVFELLLAGLGEDELHSRLRMCESGGAVVSPDLVRRTEAKLDVQFLPIWGCTESTGVALHVPPWDGERRLEMLGKPVADYALRVVDADPVTGVGELAVRGGAVVAGYQGQPDETARKFLDGWYLTGDLVRAESGGYFRFLGRQEEMIKVGGLKVYLLEVERVIAELDAVEQVVVVPANDPLRGEVPRAVIVKQRSLPLTREEVLRHCRDRLEAHMVPRKVEFWDELPATPSGKVNKRAVAERLTWPLALAVNSMLIGERDIAEAFRLTARVRGRDQLAFVDLRSRRSAASDPGGTWAVAHHNAAFDLADRADVARAVALAEEHDVQVASVSVYAGACDPADRAYGMEVIDRAYDLAAVAPDGTLLLRLLGGDLWARARSVAGRWQDIRSELRDQALETVQAWEAHTRQRAAETGRKVVLGLEIHHGQYLSNLHDLHHCCRGLARTGWEFVGFLEDPANRFIASEGERMDSLDFARVVRALGGRIIGYHLKDVSYLTPWSQYHPQPMQRVGEPVFVWGTHKYAWSPLGEGELDLESVVIAAQTLSEPVHPFCPVSAEYVMASTDEEEAWGVLEGYIRLLRDGRL